MYFDALTLAAVVDELQTTILGGRVQRALMPHALGVALEIYAQRQRRYLILSAHPQFARVHLSSARPSRGVEGDLPLLLLLRKYVVGGRVMAIEQPELERVVLISIAKGPLTRNSFDDPDDAPEDESLEEQLDQPMRCELVIEAMERRANIVLVGDDNIVLESARHVTPRMSRRPVQPHEPYELPPRQNKRDPRFATCEGLQALLSEQPRAMLAQALVAGYRGLSPQAAREVVYRCMGQIETPLAEELPWDQLAATLRSLWAGDWQPCLAFGELAATQGPPLAYAPYLLTQYPHSESQPSISVTLEHFYAAREPLTAHRQRRDALAQTLQEARERLERQRRQLLGEMEQARELDRLRWEGEMIYAFLHALTPGQQTLEVEDRIITLDPGRSPIEHAQERFRAYDKAKGALANVPERLQQVEARLAGLDQLLALLELADSYEQIEELGREAVEYGYLKADTGRKAKTRRLQPLKVESRNGYMIYVGRSAGQNEQVTFMIGASDDLWLHVRNMPGAHVIIKSGGRDVPEETLLEAAGLAAYFSKGRADTSVEVEVARRRLVRRVPHGPPGLVTYRAERTLRVAPQAPIPTKK